MVKIRENPIKMDDLGVPTPIFGNIHIYVFLLNIHVNPLSTPQVQRGQLGSC